MRPELDDTQEAPISDPAHTATLGGAAVIASAGLQLGQQIGHFRIDAKLGAGGMGEVYRGTDLALDRPVAIKVLPDALSRDPVRRDRLIREARAQARITHPHVGHIYFIGEETGRLYFAMELVAGETLADRVARGPLRIDDALAMIRGAALGLREAQRSGFTHRDVKPSNLMVDAHGEVKVLDFGLAAGAPEAAVGPSGPVAQTSIAGTPLYMAPEQARGEPIDLRADIYALGATLYHLVSGTPPFQADTVDALLSLHATAERPNLPRRGRPRVAVAAIATLCAKMMAANRADRFATYDDLLHAIDLLSASHTRPAGFWTRGIATALDIVLVTIVAALAAAALSLGGASVDANSLLFPLFAGYQMLAIKRWGGTAGKALLELEVIDVETGRPPTLARSAVRAGALAGLPALGIFAGDILQLTGREREIASAVVIVSCLVLLLALLVGALRSQGKRSLWDRIARTMVRYRMTRR